MNKVVIVFFSVLFTMGMANTACAERAKRPMKVHKVEELGLEIWTEYSPQWSTELIHRGSKDIFTTQTPANYYPPAAMTYYTFPEMNVAEVDFEAMAVSAVRRAAQNYHVKKAERNKITVTPANYNGLNGFEGTFSGMAHGEPVDVKIFIGNKPGNASVVMQAQTLQGKLPHLSEQLRRAWNHVSYLAPSSTEESAGMR